MKAADHTRVTEEAVRRFVRYSPGPVSPMLLRHSQLVQRGAREEDSSPLFVRSTNWHFSNRNLDCDLVRKSVWPFMEPLTIHLSSERLLQHHCRQLEKEAGKGAVADCCELTGRILHHIQDMSIPSHVVPIYHGPLVPDSLETYLHECYLAEDGRLADLPLQENIAASLLPEPDATVLQLYRDSAESTLTLLRPKTSCCRATVYGKPILLPWSWFWGGHTDTPNSADTKEGPFAGFGRFGPLGKHFGRPEIRLGDDHYSIAQQVYDDFCRVLMRKMLVESIKTLFLLVPQLKKLC